MTNNRSVEQEFNTLKQLVMNILETNVECRDNDAKLYVEVCRELNLNTLQEVYDSGIAPTSVTRVRQKLMNDDKLFQPSDFVKQMRKERQQSFAKLMKKLKEAN